MTAAERIDRAIVAAARAAEAKAAALERYELCKQDVAQLARRHGVRDGLSWRLAGRNQHCTLTRNQVITVDAEQVAAGLDPDWRRALFLRRVEFVPTSELHQALRSRAARRSLPAKVRDFLRQQVQVTRFLTLRFNGSSATETGRQ